jgi:undecaprenyl-diphosphatase
MMADVLSNLDRAVFLLINRDLTNAWLDVFFITITNGRFWIVPGALAAIAFGLIERKKALIVLGLAIMAVAISDPVCYRIIKPLVHRLRPCNPLALVESGRFLLGYKTSLSFPSAHAMNMFAAAALFALAYPRRWPCFFIFAALIGYSRIYVGVHYPLDVLAGAFFGIAIGAGVFWVYHYFSRRRRKSLLDK